MAPMAKEIEKETECVRSELARADGKSATLVGLTGAAVAFISTQVSGNASLAVRVILGTAGLLFAGAAITLLIGVLRPYLGSTGFLAYAEKDPEEAAKICDDVKRHPEKELVILSTICRRKFHRLRWAVDLAVAGLVVIFIGLIVGTF